MVRAWRAGNGPGEECARARQSCRSRSWAKAVESTEKPWKSHRMWQHLGLDLGLVSGRGEGSGGCHDTVSCRYRAVYQYRPQNEDELELREGDRVDVMQQCDDGWFVGMCGWGACWGVG